MKASDLVFIGTVDSIGTAFLNRWNASSPQSLKALNEAHAQAQAHPTAAKLAILKDAYRKTFPEMPEERRRELQVAKTTQEVVDLFYSALDRGQRVSFRVKTPFKKQDGKTEQRADVWTPFDDCGFDFEVGESYLVYANEDEDTGYLFTSTCTRTRRLSDAGDDLSYLLFYQDDPGEAARFEAFATTDRLDRIEGDTVKSPVANVIVQIRSGALTRYAHTDQKGHVVFDGLPAADYQISAFASGYRSSGELLAGPQAVHIAQRSCTRQLLILPAIAP